MRAQLFAFPALFNMNAIRMEKACTFVLFREAKDLRWEISNNPVSYWILNTSRDVLMSINGTTTVVSLFSLIQSSI